ncbi:MAG: hypothetical protein ACKO2T_26605, partial [Microcystis aeruginosa]
MNIKQKLSLVTQNLSDEQLEPFYLKPHPTIKGAARTRIFSQAPIPSSQFQQFKLRPAVIVSAND